MNQKKQTLTFQKDKKIKKEERIKGEWIKKENKYKTEKSRLLLLK